MDGLSDYKNALVFRLNDHGQGPELIRQVFLELGWVEFDEDEQEEYDWNLWWKTSRFRNCDHDNVTPWQRLNHYPKSTAITKKDALARNLKRMRGVYGPSVYNFSPVGFNLPNDYTKFVAEYTKMKEKDPEKVFWICKPADLSRGRGIFVFKELSELQYDCNAVVQQYITNPLLISGYKFDLRIYVLVPSFHPLNIYIYQEGLVRFSTEKYDLSSLKNMYSHLTNTSINKNSPAYSVDKERIGPGCKWTLTQLRHYFHSVGIDDAPMFAKIINIIILTLLVQIQQVPKVTNCFELYGFDIIFDENLKPWLLEVNFSPALSTDCSTDFVVKKPLLHDLIELMHFTDEDKERGGEEYREMRSQVDALRPNFGGRRSHLGSNNNNRKQPGQLQKRGSSNRLPSIQSQNKNSSPRSVLSGDFASSMNEQEDSGVSDALVPAVQQQPVPTLIPGYGLPSVQLPKSRGRPAAVDSGHTTPTEPNDVKDNEQENLGLGKLGEKDNVTSNHRLRDVTRNQDPMSNGKAIQHYEQHAHMHDPHSVKPSIEPKGHKSSVNSDSGVSSYSGSSNGDNRHTQGQPPGEGRFMKSLSYTHKSDNHKRLNHINYRDSALKEADQRNPETLDSTITDSSRQDMYERDFNSKLESMRKGMTNQDSSSQRGSLVPAGARYRTNRKGERLTRISRDFRSPRKPLQSYSSSSQTQVYTRPPPPRSVSQMSNFNPGQSTSKSSLRDKRSNYSKPWRRTASQNKELEKTAPPKPTPQCPLQVVGDFHLVFPFNEVCKRTSDPKIIIKECQKYIKKKIAKASEESSKTSKQSSRNVSPQEVSSLGSASSSRLGSDFTSHVSSVGNFGTGSKEGYPGSGRSSKMNSRRNSRSSSTALRSSSKTLIHASSSSLNTVASTEQPVKYVPPNRNVFASEPAELWSPLKLLPQDSG